MPKLMPLPMTMDERNALAMFRWPMRELGEGEGDQRAHRQRPARAPAPRPASESRAAAPPAPPPGSDSVAISIPSTSPCCSAMPLMTSPATPIVNRGPRLPRRLVELPLDRGGQPRPAVEIAAVESGANDDQLQSTVR